MSSALILHEFLLFVYPILFDGLLRMKFPGAPISHHGEGKNPSETELQLESDASMR